MPKITKRLVEALEPKKEEYFVWDSELKGFAVKITPKGKRVYMLYYRTKDHRQRKPAIGAHGQITCDQARNIAQEWLVLISKGGDPSLEKQINRQSLTISELAEKYLTDYSQIHKKSYSTKIEKVHLNNDILPQIGKLKLNSLTQNDILTLHKSLKHKPITANRCLVLISKMLNLAEKWGLRDDAGTLCKHIDKYPETKREKFLSMSEIENLFRVLQEAEMHKTFIPSTINAIRLLLLTGCRLSEILTLKWEYIDIENFRINFPDSKTGKKTTYISPFAIEILNSIPKVENNPYVLQGKVEGKNLANLQKAWIKIREKAGIPDVRIHDLRHSFASIGAASGLSLPIIGALLGHNQVKTTARYAHLVGDPLREAASLIGDKIKSAIK